MTERVKVWDLGVRVFHWALVAAFAIVWLTSEDEGQFHLFAGYAVAGLIAFRVLWGFVGGRYARFTAFLYSPRETLAYLRANFGGQPKRYLSHNPLGALMVFALLMSLSGIVVSGLALNGDLPGVSATERESEHEDEADEHSTLAAQPAEQVAAEASHETWEEVHEFFANLTLLLVVLHVLGVIHASRQHKEKLIVSMLTGLKDTSSH